MSDQFETPEHDDPVELPENTAVTETPNPPNPRGGPRTEEGKARSRFNAVRHGLTSKVVIFPWEDSSGYELLCRQMREHYQPVGPMEEYYVQAIADAIWKRNRSNDAESCILVSYLHRHLGILETAGALDLDVAVIKGMMYEEQAQKLGNLSRCAQRVENQIRESQKNLEALQATRKKEEEEALLEAAVLKREHDKHPENKGIAYNPAEDGFVLTLEQVEQWIRRQERRQRAGLSYRSLPAAPKIHGREPIAA